MVTLDGWADYVRLYVLATVLGAVGGLVFDLLQTRKRRTGLIELPTKVGSGYVDLGTIASMIVGAVAAVAVLWIFPPEVDTNVTQNGATTTTTHYDIIKVVGLSLIVGSAGGSFLSAMQARALALVKGQQAATTERVAKGQIAAIKTQVEEGASTEQLAGAVAAAEVAVKGAGDSGPGDPRPEDF